MSDKTVTTSTATGAENALPRGWTWIAVGDTGIYINGYPFKPEDRETTGLPIIRIQNLTDESKPLNRTTLEVPSDYRVNPGDMLVSWSATVDVFVWRGSTALVNQHIFRVVPASAVIDPRLLFYWLKVAIPQLLNSEHLHGSTMKHINRGPFMAHRLPLPPLGEQVRIVEKLEEALSDLDAGVAELEAAQKKLARYRQSLLKAAVEGTLTADWRAERTRRGDTFETGPQLLERILRERRARWEEKQLAKFEAQGKVPPDGWQGKYSEPAAISSDDLQVLPSGWVWASLSQIGWLDRGRSTHRPRNAPHLYGGPYPFIQTGDIRHADTYISASEATYSEHGLAQSKLWSPGTMCITIAANIGKTAILTVDACFPDSVVGFLPAGNEVSVRYVEYFMRSAQQQLESSAPATAQKNINLEVLTKLAVPLPPIAEQSLIVERLDAAMAAASDIERAMQRGCRESDAQRQNILRAAFSGRLVPQDPADEPASALLARIRAERAKQASSAPKRRASARTSKAEPC